LDANYTKKNIEVEIIDTNNVKHIVKAIRKSINGVNMYTFSLPKPIKAKTLMIQLKKTKTSEVKILDAAVFLNERYAIPFYAFHLTSPRLLESKKYSVKLGQLTNGSELTVFYKSAQNKDLLAKEKWKTAQQLDLISNEFTPAKGELYQFLIMYKPLHNWSFLNGFELVLN